MKFFRTQRFVLVVFSFFLFGEVSGAAKEGKDRRLIIVKMGTSGKRISSEWRDAIASRMSSERLDSFLMLKRSLTKEEIAWKKLIESRKMLWNSFRDSLALPFNKVVLQDTVFVMLGFLGDDDAFTFGKQTVCLDLTALCKVYGNAELPENQERIDRIFSHEYTHLLHKLWASNSHYKPFSFMDDILWECFYEGMGMYRSLKPSWLPTADSMPKVTEDALKELYPIFVERLVTIAKNPKLSEEEKENLHKNLSRGSVQKKWGAFPVAIWLQLEAQTDQKNLRKWIDSGPRAVISLALKYLPPELRSKLSTVFAE